jgi:sugar phosphate isomerase/epimerase
MNSTRRTFLKTSLVAGAWAAASRGMAGALAPHSTRPLPIGLQLYSVRDVLPTDFEGTLRKLAALGYQEVEAAGFFGHSPADVKQMMASAGLRCVSAHYSLADLMKTTPQTIEYAQALGLRYLVCSSPWSANPDHLTHYPGGAWQGILHSMSLDDWQWSAEQFNRLGEQMHAAGIQFCYHNHTMEFQDHHGVTGYETLLTQTNPEHVKFELDCGWAIAAGQNPVELLHKHEGRIVMLHVKDMKPAAPGTAPAEHVATELGLGTINYRPILETAFHTGIRHMFVEQEGFDKPLWEALKIDYDYLNRIDRA